METVKRITDLDPKDVAVVERVFGQPLTSPQNVELVLRTVPPAPAAVPLVEIPSWFKVLEGLSDEDLADVNATIEQPLILARQ